MKRSADVDVALRFVSTCLKKFEKYMNVSDVFKGNRKIKFTYRRGGGHPDDINTFVVKIFLYEGVEVPAFIVTYRKETLLFDFKIGSFFQLHSFGYRSNDKKFEIPHRNILDFFKRVSDLYLNYELVTNPLKVQRINDTFDEIITVHSSLKLKKIDKLGIFDI